ncbi:MAG: pyridoxal-dependent decarboxylase [Phycisphaerales bacterium]
MNPPEHWSADDFRRHAHAAVDFIADYWDRLRSPAAPWPVRSARRPGETAALLPDAPPQRPEPWDAIAADLDRVVLPGLTHWQSPNFFGYFPANISGPSVIGELLSAGLGVQGMLWSTSPACTEIETRMLDWMARAVDLPRRFWSTAESGGGVIQGTASEATLVALVAARARARACDRADQPPGVDERFVVYTSRQAHSSVVKAAMIAGLSRDVQERDGLVGGPASGVRLIDTDDQHRLRPDLLEQAIAADRAARRRPCMVVATVGTTGCAAIDDVRAIGTICARERLWLHVDAAHAGSACICPEHRAIIDGIELADSWSFNPHKWLLTNFDCALMWTADRAALVGALSITPEYLRNAASDAGVVWDYRDWQIPLGRRFRALKLWLVMRSYGLDGLRAHIREHVRLAELFESLVRSDDRFEIVTPARLGLVCFRLCAGDDPTRRLLERVNADGRVFLSHAVLPVSAGTPGAPADRFVIRMAVGGRFTGEAHVRAAWQHLGAAAGT